MRQKVGLEGLKFYSFHGFYSEENIVGNEYIVDIETETDVFGDGSDDLSNTVNYERLHTIAATEMSLPRKLIETVAHSILDTIRHEFLSTKNIKVRIRKLNPPMGAEIKYSYTELSFSR